MEEMLHDTERCQALDTINDGNIDVYIMREVWICKQKLRKITLLTRKVISSQRQNLQVGVLGDYGDVGKTHFLKFQ